MIFDWFSLASPQWNMTLARKIQLEGMHCSRIEVAWFTKSRIDVSRILLL